jgi:hypothetical protein
MNGYVDTTGLLWCARGHAPQDARDRRSACVWMCTSALASTPHRDEWDNTIAWRAPVTLVVRCSRALAAAASRKSLTAR